MYRQFTLRKKAIDIFHNEICKQNDYIPTIGEENAFIEVYLFQNGENPQDAYDVPWDVAVYGTAFCAGAFLFTIGTLGIAAVGIGATAAAVGGSLMMFGTTNFFMRCAKEKIEPDPKE